MHGSIKRRTEISIETHSVTVIRTSRNGGGLVHCSTCGRGVRQLTRHQASVVFGVNSETVDRLAADLAVHQTDESQLCGMSLIEHFGGDVRFVTEAAE